MLVRDSQICTGFLRIIKGHAGKKHYISIWMLELPLAELLVLVLAELSELASQVLMMVLAELSELASQVLVMVLAELSALASQVLVMVLAELSALVLPLVSIQDRMSALGLVVLSEPPSQIPTLVLAVLSALRLPSDSLLDRMSVLVLASMRAWNSLALHFQYYFDEYVLPRIKANQ